MATPFTLGTTSYTSYWTISGGTKVVNRIYFGVRTNVLVNSLELHIHTASAAAKVRGLIFADAGGVPGALLGTTDELVGAVVGANTLTFPASVSVPGTSAWFGFFSDTQLNVRATNSGTALYNGDAYADGAADPFGSTSSGGYTLALTASGVADPIYAVQVAKTYGYVVLAPPTGYRVAKAYGYAVLDTNHSIAVPKVWGYAVLDTQPPPEAVVRTYYSQTRDRFGRLGHPSKKQTIWS